MNVMTLAVMTKVIDFMCYIYSPTLVVCGIVGIFLSILTIH